MVEIRDQEKQLPNPEPENPNGDSTAAGGARGAAQELACGRLASTLFALTGIVAIVVWSAAAVIAAILFLVISLA